MAINLNHIDNSILIGTSEKVRITSAGNVGINQTNPTEKLDVNGTIQCLNELRSTTGNDLLLNAGSANRDVKIQVNDVNMMYVQGSTAKVGVGIDSPDSKLHIHNGSAGSIAASSAANLTIESSASDYNVLQFLSPSSAAQQIRFGDVSDNGAGWIQYNHSNNALSFGTAGPEKMRLSSDGFLLVGTTDSGFSSGYTTMTIGNTSTSNTGLTIASSASNGYSRLHFADGNSGAARYAGWIAYNHGTDELIVSTNNSGSHKVVLDSSGRVAFGGLTPSNYYSTYDDFVWGATSGSVGMTIVSGSDSSGYITWADGTSSADAYRGRLFYSHSDNSFNFRCNGLTNNIFKLDSSTATVTGTTDGVLNLDTSSSNGTFIRFKQGGTTKNWIGCATGLGGYGDADDLTITATDNIIFAANSAQRMRLTGSGQLLIGTTSSSDQFHLLKSHNGHTRAVIQNNWGANATAQLKIICATDEFQLVKYASGAAAINLSNNSTMYMSIGGSERLKIRGDSTGQTTHIVNTPSPGGNGVASQYVTQPYGMSGNYTNFRVTVTASGWHSFFLKMYVSGYSGDSAYRWVTGYCNNGFGTIRTSHSDNSGDFGSGTLTHISGQSWRYDIAVSSGSVTHPVMFVELAVAGSGNISGNGAVVCAIT